MMAFYFNCIQLMADNSGQLLLALYSTVTKSHLTDNRFDVQVLIVFSFNTIIYAPFQVLSDLENYIHLSCFKTGTEVSIHPMCSG